MNITYPIICQKNDGRYFIDFYINSKRYRLLTASKIGLDLKPNNYPENLRRKQAELLAKLTYDYLIRNNYSFKKVKHESKLERFDYLVNRKLSENLSMSYHKALKTYSLVLREQILKKDYVPIEFIDDYLLSYSNNTSFNTVRRHVNVLTNYLNENGFDITTTKLKSKKQNEKLHKPIKDISCLLNLLRRFDSNIHLCCLLTYGCLLRPHREIRLLKWKDFSDDLSTISISGDRVKSKRNRIVPVPKYIREILVKKGLEDNIFSGTETPYNISYFSTLFKRFKRTFSSVDKGVNDLLF